MEAVSTGASASDSRMREVADPARGEGQPRNSLRRRGHELGFQRMSARASDPLAQQAGGCRAPAACASAAPSGPASGHTAGMPLTPGTRTLDQNDGELLLLTTVEGRMARMGHELAFRVDRWTASLTDRKSVV